ncbi:recombinase family protein [Ramlibacter sp. AN1133]|uniref:recombinase family protein n=1 Tax=Ramlibacter sp. AN1133 TaxID=3133429 RepID=UPI0030C4CD08
MSTQTRPAAQYIRMSTDRQDLSPVVQKHAIAEFARANGFEIVRSYEDEGRSGLQLANRPKLRQLLGDVADAAPFSAILVYDVSRWGRFQDADAAAYYEYHCRLNGVQVIYVSESFANDHTPVTVLLKSMRRVMAAEYSRDIASKSRAGQERVVAKGFQMGPLPALGYRRCSVSADGSRRLMLEHGQRKAALTDRIEWVLAPDAEVQLVQRICRAYAGGLRLVEIASLANAEGWRTNKGRGLSAEALKRFLKNEALIGNFVWGVKSKGGKVIQCAPSRQDGCLPRIVDDATWARVQARFQGVAQRRPGHTEAPGTRDCARLGAPRQLRLPLAPAVPEHRYRRTLGAAQQLRDHTREFGRALSAAMATDGLPAAFDVRNNALTFWGARVRVRLMWPSAPGTWLLERNRCAPEIASTLVVRMARLYVPLDFFLLPSALLPALFSRPLQASVPRELQAYWLNSADPVIARLRAIAARTSAGLQASGPQKLPSPARC